MMNIDNSQIIRLIRWNRFWVILVACFVLIGSYNYLENCFITSGGRLEVRWSGDDLEFSSLGGPFIVTHLVAEPDPYLVTSMSDIAELPHPFFVRGPKVRSFILESEFKKLKWLDYSGKEVEPPHRGDPIVALYYKMDKVQSTKNSK